MTVIRQGALVRAIIDRPVLIATTLLIGLFTVWYTASAARPVSNATVDLRTFLFAIGWLYIFIIGVQIAARTPGLRRLIAIATFAGSCALFLSLQWHSINELPATYIVLGLGLAIAKVGVLAAPRISFASIMGVVFCGFAINASAVQVPSEAGFAAVLTGLLVQLSLIIAMTFHGHAGPDRERSRAAAATILTGTAPFVFYTILCVVALVIAVLFGLPDTRSFASFRPVASAGFFVLPILLTLPGFVFLAKDADDYLHAEKFAGILSDLPKKVWARARPLFSSSSAYAILAIFAIGCIVGLLVFRSAIFLPLLFAWIVFALCAGFCFFSLRVLVAMMVLIPLILTATLSILLAFGQQFGGTTDFLLMAFQATFAMLVLVRDFSDLSANQKYGRTMMDGLISASVGPYLLIAGTGIAISALAHSAGFWQAGSDAAIFNLVAMLITLIVGPALLSVLAARYGKF